MLISIITESVRFAWLAIINNRLRTFLSLLGVTIGIIAIISVFTIVDALEKNVRSSVESLGENVVYIQKWPWGGSGEYQWWKYYKRPKVNFKEFKKVQDICKSASASAFFFEGKRTVKNGNTILEDVEICGITFGFPQILTFNMEKGRFFSQSEMKSGKKFKNSKNLCFFTVFDKKNAKSPKWFQTDSDSLARVENAKSIKHKF